MIKLPKLEDAHALSVLHPDTFALPSREQIRRLDHGDFAKVNAGGERFWTRIIWIRGTDLLGIVDNNLVTTADHGLQLGDVIAFTTFNIYQVEPGDHPMKLSPWMLLMDKESEETGTLHVLHTAFPRFVGVIIFEEKKVTMKDVKLFDEPLDYGTDMPKLLREGANWFFYKYVNEK